MTHGKYGRLPRDTSRYAPALEDYRTTGGALPVATGAVDRATKVPSWPMYNNDPDPTNPKASPDGLGDCTIAGAAHLLSAMCVYGGHPFPVFSESSIVGTYSAVSGYDPSTGANDNGAQCQDVLKHLHNVGMRDEAGKVHKAAAYAALRDPGDTTELANVLYTFGSVYLGIACPASAQEQFGHRDPVWAVVSGSPIDGGHCIVLQRRRASGTGVLMPVTWGQLIRMTMGFASTYIEEAWAVVSEDFIEASGKTCDGYDLTQLLADMAYV